MDQVKMLASYLLDFASAIYDGRVETFLLDFNSDLVQVLRRMWNFPSIVLLIGGKILARRGDRKCALLYANMAEDLLHMEEFSPLQGADLRPMFFDLFLAVGDVKRAKSIVAQIDETPEAERTPLVQMMLTGMRNRLMDEMAKLT